MTNKVAAANLKKAADRFGIVATLAQCGSNIKLRIPMTRKQWESDIENLNLSVRALNGLRRTGARNIGAVAEIVMSDKGLNNVRNIGKKSINEIKTALLTYGYADFSDSEKMKFWEDFIRENF